MTRTPSRMSTCDERGLSADGSAPSSASGSGSANTREGAEAVREPSAFRANTSTAEALTTDATRPASNMTLAPKRAFAASLAFGTRRDASAYSRASGYAPEHGARGRRRNANARTGRNDMREGEGAPREPRYDDEY